MRKQTNTLSPSPKGFQSPKFSDSDIREVRGLGLGLGRPKSSDQLTMMALLCFFSLYPTVAHYLLARPTQDPRESSFFDLN
jgi:hypothetical protein